MLDFPASGYALWTLSDLGGPRPEYLLPVLYYESGFDPSIQNRQGYAYFGLNQISGGWLTKLGIEPSDYLTWSASQQLARVVTPYFLNQVKLYGRLDSGTRVYQAEFLPASLAIARDLSSILAKPQSLPCPPPPTSDVYCANAVFDYTHSGVIRVSDLAHAVETRAVLPAVQSAIAQTYALRPGESPRDPVYGTDFNRFPWGAIAAGVAIVAVGGAVAYAIEQETRR